MRGFCPAIVLVTLSSLALANCGSDPGPLFLPGLPDASVGIDVAAGGGSDVANKPGADFQFTRADLGSGTDDAVLPGNDAAAPGMDAAAPGMDVNRPPPPEYPMYAHDNTQLFVVTPPSFDLKTIGPFGVSDDMTDLAVTPDGSVYTISNTTLYRVDPQTAAATMVTTLGSGAQSNVALTFLPDGTLLAGDKDGVVRKVDPRNGTVTEVGSFGDGLASAGDLVAVADGTMYGISDAGSADAETNNILIKVDTTTGMATRVGQIGFGQVWGMAYNVGHVYAFTQAGEIIEIDPATGAGTLKRMHPVEFWGAGVTPLVRPQG